MHLRLILGFCISAAAFAPLAVGAWAVRRRCLPSWTGAPAILVQIVGFVSALVVIAQVLGAVGLFSLVPLTVSYAATGSIGWYWGRRGLVATSDGALGGGAVEEIPVGAPTRASLMAFWLSAAVVAAPWVTQMARTLQGQGDPETLRYHLPLAARFANEGSLLPVHYVDTDAGSLIAFYPHLTEIFHALGMVYFDTDLFSTGVNALWLVVAVLGAWCIGRPFKVGPISGVGALVALGTPQMVSAEAGNGTNDLFGIAMVMAAAAILVNAERGPGTASRAAIASAAMAAGLAGGSKYTFLAALGAMTVGVVWMSPSGDRVRRVAVWSGFSLATGGFWYLRNLFIVGNPLPPMALGLGPIALPQVTGPLPTSTILEHLADGEVWRETFAPGLRLVWGPAWMVIGLLVGVAVIALVAAPPTRTVRMLAAVAAAVVAAYVAGPQVLGPNPGETHYFVWNVRYAAHALVLLLALVPTVPRLGRRGAEAVLLGYLSILGVTQLDATLWPVDLFEERYATATWRPEMVVGILTSAAVAATGLLVVLRPRVLGGRRRMTAVAAAAITIAAIVSASIVAPYYDDHRFSRARATSIGRWMLEADGERLAVVGLQLQYIAYGDDRSNHVQYLGREQDHEFMPITSCTEWREVVNDGGYTHVLVGPTLFSASEPAERRWIDDDPAARLLLEEGRSAIYALDGPLDAAGCPRDDSAGHG